MLTDEQYSSDHLTSSGWLETFRSDASYADAIFFFGYSMSDIDIARLMYENPSLIEKTFIVVGRSPKRVTQIAAPTYDSLVCEDVADVALRIPAASDERAARAAPFLNNLIRVEMEPADRAASRDVVVSYLIKGDTDTRYIARDLANGLHDYFISRDAINARAETLGARPERILIHSKLGEGKTSAMWEVAHYLYTAGWSVLWFNGVTEGLEYDFDYLHSLDSVGQQKTALIFENCFAYSRQIRDLVERFPLVSMYLSSRSSALQTRVGDIADAFGEDYELIDLSTLTDSEIQDVDDLLYSNGLWGARQGDSRDGRLDYIRNSARADLATLLVDVCRSSDLFARFRGELRNLNQHPAAVRKSLIVALFIAYAGHRLSLAQLCEVVEADLFKMGRYQSDAVVAEFIDFGAGRVTVRSSTFAKAVLKDAVADSLIVDILPSLIARLDWLSDQNSIYTELVKSLMRFGVIEGILSDNDKEAKLVAYYEAIRAAGVGLNNPQFWLQYAIACMSFKDFANADGHFRTAFGLAERRGGYDPYQIENQYARFLIESRTSSQDWGDSYESLKQANEIVSRQMANFNEGSYPYRVARSYLAFVEANDGLLTRDQKARISEWCTSLMVLGTNAPPNIKSSRYWREAQQRLRQTIDYLAS